MGTLATLAAIRCAQGRAAEAVVDAERSLAIYAMLQMFDFYKGSFARLVHAEALYASGAVSAARAAISAARDLLLARAIKIEDPAVRRSFLENVPENARTQELAAKWLTEA
jgi:hypothetical protein